MFNLKAAEAFEIDHVGIDDLLFVFFHDPLTAGTIATALAGTSGLCTWRHATCIWASRPRPPENVELLGPSYSGRQFGVGSWLSFARFAVSESWINFGKKPCDEFLLARYCLSRTHLKTTKQVLLGKIMKNI